MCVCMRENITIAVANLIKYCFNSLNALVGKYILLQLQI